MKTVTVLTQNSLLDLANCLKVDELEQLVIDLDKMIIESYYHIMMRDRIDNDDNLHKLILWEIINFSIFCRDRMDVINELVSCVETEELPEEDFKKMVGEID